MSTEPWSAATLRVWPGELTVAEIHAEMQIDDAEQGGRNWRVRLGPKDMHLHDRLQTVEAFLTEKREVLARLAVACRIDLFVSWTPKAGQDGILISAGLIKLLAEFAGDILMDTHTDD